MKNYKGVWSYPSSDTYWTDTAQKGDYWIYNGVAEICYHRQTFKNGDIMYFDGTRVVPIQVKKKDKAIRPTESIYDICIIGGGAGGIGACYALKDSGLKVCLIEKMDALGGNHLQAGMFSLIASPINGTWFKELMQECYNENTGSMYFGKTSGDLTYIGNGTEFEQLYLGSLYNNSASNLGNQIRLSPTQISKKYYDALKETIDIRLNTLFLETIYSTDENKPVGIKVKDLRNDGKEYSIFANYFIDCSADGVFCRSGKTEGTDYFIGTDAKSKYNESALADGFTGNKYDINPVEVIYKAPGKSFKKGDFGNEFTEDFTKIKSFSDITSGQVNGMYYLPDSQYIRVLSPGKNLKVPAKTFIDKGQEITYAEAIQRAHYHYTLTGYNSTGSTHGGFGGCYPMLAIRESYRIKCDRMIVQSDIETRATSDNLASNHTIALSSWYCDIHNSTNIGEVNSAWLNGVPYESLIPSAFKNVLVGSRCLGASHLGASAIRLTKTMMSVGYACGKAMQLAVSSWLDDVRNVDITTLQSNIGIADTLAEIDTYFPQN